MTPATTIAVQDWMKLEETKALMSALNDEESSQTLFVGGCVRNALLNVPVGDLDLATMHTPDQVTKRLEEVNIRVIPTGIDHGTVTAIINEQSFEITTLRKDVETDGRHAVVAFSKNWQEDAQRRDFTINTLLADMHGNIFDPTGQGMGDLNTRRIRFVGEARARIAEDYLRILRYFRFHALYGEGDVDAEILNACREASPHIEKLSRERITQEFLKITMVEKPEDVLRAMRDNNILSALFEYEGGNLEILKNFAYFQTKYEAQQLSSRLFIMVGQDIKKCKNFERYLIVSKIILKDIEAINLALKHGPLSHEQKLKTAIYKCGKTATIQAVLIRLAMDEMNNVEGSEAIRVIKSWDVPTFPLRGDDLIKEGFESGPELGQELAARERAWIENGFKF